MSEIKRHYVYEDSGTMAKGCYINEKDHLSAIQQAKIDAVREFADSICNKEISQWSQRLRKESDWHIEQLEKANGLSKGSLKELSK